MTTRDLAQELLASVRQAKANRAADLALRAAQRRGQVERVEAVIDRWVVNQYYRSEIDDTLRSCTDDIRIALEIPKAAEPDYSTIHDHVDTEDQP